MVEFLCCGLDSKGNTLLSKETQIYELQQQNERLQAELDREIKNNRKIVKALKEYANKDLWSKYTFEGLRNVFNLNWYDNGYKLAQQVLKEIEEV